MYAARWEISSGLHGVPRLQVRQLEAGQAPSKRYTRCATIITIVGVGHNFTVICLSFLPSFLFQVWYKPSYEGDRRAGGRWKQIYCKPGFLFCNLFEPGGAGLLVRAWVIQPVMYLPVK